MLEAAHYIADLVAIGALVLGLYFPRHRRRDLVVAYLGVNIGVMAVSSILVSTAVAAGLGLGLFGVLSIIRLRSEELNQTEVAHYFAALALGLIGGIGVGMPALAMALMALVLVAVYVGDHPMVSRRTVRQDLLVDRAIVDQATLRAHVELLLGHEVTDVTVRRTDLVNDTTLVTVTSRADAATRATIAQTARVGS